MHDGENHFQPAIGVKEPFSIVLVVKATQLKNHQEQMCTQDRRGFSFFFFFFTAGLSVFSLALASFLVFSPPFQSPDFVSCLAAILNSNCFVSSKNEIPARLKAATPSPFLWERESQKQKMARRWNVRWKVRRRRQTIQLIFFENDKVCLLVFSPVLFL